MVSILNKFFKKIFVLNMPAEGHKVDEISEKMRKFNIDFHFLKAIDGRTKKIDRLWNIYTKRPLSTYYERERKKKFLISRGALGYLKTMENLLIEAISNKYDNMLVFDNDCIFDKQFDEKAKGWFRKLGTKRWKLILFGASDYDLSNINPIFPHYSPTKFKTCGSFSIGIHHSCYSDILNEVIKMETPFDNLPVGMIYEKYPEQCFVIYPNIVIADVRNSSIRHSRDLKSHGKLMGWQLDNFEL